MKVEIDYAVTEDDFAKLFVLHQRRLGLLPYPLISCVLALIVLGFVWRDMSEIGRITPRTAWMLAGFTLVLARLLFHVRVVRYQARRQYRSLSSWHGRFKARFTAQGVTITGLRDAGFRPWDAYDASWMDEDLLVLVRQRLPGPFFPRRAFDEEGWKQVTEWVQCVGDSAKRGKNRVAARTSPFQQTFAPDVLRASPDAPVLSRFVHVSPALTRSASTEPDRTVPFVAAVYRMIDGGGSLEQALAVLQEAELRCGTWIIGTAVEDHLRELSDETAFRAAALRVLCAISGQSQGSFDVTQPPWPTDDDWEPRFLLPLVAETQIVLTGSDFCNPYGFLACNGSLGSYTWRGWGGIVAEWATQAWEAGDRPWSYLDFYDGFKRRWMVGTYPVWADAVLSVLAEQDRRVCQALGLADPDTPS